MQHFVNTPTPVTIETMIILGIETSCDETAASVVKDGKELLSNVVFSSMDLHKAYGGVVPEIAARSHIESITTVIEQALEEAFGHLKTKPETTNDKQSLKSQISNLKSNDPWSMIDGIAVTHGAGLGGSLLVGVMTARTLAITKNKPLYAINHVEGHVYANFLTETSENSKSETPNPKQIPNSQITNTKQWPLGNQTYILPTKKPQFPFLALIVSGGHSQLALFNDHFDYELLGQTRDDAIGEAFDKVAKIIGLPYPGGPSVSEAAKSGDPNKYSLPKAKLTPKPRPRVSGLNAMQGDGEEAQQDVHKSTLSEHHSQSTQQSAKNKDSANSSAGRQVDETSDSRYEFSFSGIKTAVLRLAQELIGEDYTFPSHQVPEKLSEAQRNDIAASFQRVAIETVVDKTILAFEEFLPKSVVIAGGVAANQELRRQLSERLPIEIEYTDMKLCTDNGAMIATLGCYKAMNNQEPADPYSLETKPNLSM